MKEKNQYLRKEAKWENQQLNAIPWLNNMIQSPHQSIPSNISRSFYCNHNHFTGTHLFFMFMMTLLATHLKFLSLQPQKPFETLNWPKYCNFAAMNSDNKHPQKPRFFFCIVQSQKRKSRRTHTLQGTLVKQPAG